LSKEATVKFPQQVFSIAFAPPFPLIVLQLPEQIQEHNGDDGCDHPPHGRA